MDIDRVQPLQHLTTVENLDGIRRRGICCANTARHFARRVLAEPGVMAHREKNVGRDGLKVKDYAALFFNARNPMLSKRRDEDGLVILLVESLPQLQEPTTLIAAGNAATAGTRIGSVAEILPTLEQRLVYSTSFSRDAPERWAAVQSEVLVEEVVPARFIQHCIVAAERDAVAVSAVWPGLSLEVRPDFFFMSSQ